MPGNPNDFAEHARNLLAKQTKPKMPKPAPPQVGNPASVGGSVAPVQAPKVNLKFYHPDVYKHISMHIAERLKKLNGG